MLKAVAGRLPTPASSTVISGFNRAAIENSLFLLGQNELRAANAEGVTEAERERHLQAVEKVKVELAVFTSRGKRYQFTTIPVVRG